MRVSAARPELIRMLNEQLLLDHIRANGPSSRAELARATGLSKSTVSMAMANVARAGLVREAGHRRGVPGRAARLYEVTPDAGFVLALDVGRQFLRGALANLTGSVVARETIRSRAAQGVRRVSELGGLADTLLARAGISRAEVTQTVVGCPGVYDRHADTIRLTGGLTGWDQPGIPERLRDAFGSSLMVENDVAAAALAEQAHGHGRHATSFAFVTVGTGIGMGLVLGGRLHRGAHGTAGEIAFLPFTGPTESAVRRSVSRGDLEVAVSSAAITDAARSAGMRGAVSARRVFAAAAATRLATLAPVRPNVLVSALGADAVVDGCLTAGTERAWARLTARLAGQAPAIGPTHEVSRLRPEVVWSTAGPRRTAAEVAAD